MTDAEIAWAAGLFEGEGCIRVEDVPDAPRVGLTMVMTDRDVVERFHALVGAGRVREVPREAQHHKRRWLWYLGKGDDARRLLTLFQPWLGERRGSRAAEALALLDRRDAIRLTPRTCLNCGATFTTKFARPKRGGKFCSPRCGSAYAHRASSHAARVNEEQTALV